MLFGDAAGAVLLEPTDDPEYGIIDHVFYMDGSGGKYLYMPGGGSLDPPSHETVDKKMHYIYQDGFAELLEIYKKWKQENSNISGVK